MSDTNNELIAFCNRIASQIRHSHELGIEVLSAEKNRVTLKMPYLEAAQGDVQSGALHGGAIFSLMDQACGFAAFCACYPEARIAPTLDLRIDHMRKSSRGAALFGVAECHRITANVAFTRGVVHEGNESNPVAHCVGSYMILEAGKEKGWLRK